MGGSLPRSSGSAMLRAGRTNRGAVMPTNQWKHQAPRWPLRPRRGYAHTPRKCGSSMLRASYKQLRVAPSGRTNLRELFSSRRSQLLLGWVSRGGLGTGAMLRSRLADATLPGAQTPGLLVPPSQAKAREQGMVLVLPHESRSYVKGDPWASRPRGLTSHVAPHSLSPALNNGRGMRGAGPCQRRMQTGSLVR